MVCYVYMLTNRHKTVLYTGVISDLTQRMEQHKAGVKRPFAWRYNAGRLVYAEPLDDLAAAQEYEAGLKRERRAWRERLIAVRIRGTVRVESGLPAQTTPKREIHFR